MSAKFLQVTNAAVVVSKLVNFIVRGGKNRCNCKHLFSDTVNWLFNSTFTIETTYLVALKLSTEIFFIIGKSVASWIVIYVVKMHLRVWSERDLFISAVEEGTFLQLCYCVWLCDFTFWTDVTQHMNEVRISLQGAIHPYQLNVWQSNSVREGTSTARTATAIKQYVALLKGKL